MVYWWFLKGLTNLGLHFNPTLKDLHWLSLNKFLLNNFNKHITTLLYSKPYI